MSFFQTKSFHFCLKIHFFTKLMVRDAFSRFGNPRNRFLAPENPRIHSFRKNFFSTVPQHALPFNMFLYSWYAAGYTDVCPEKFDNPQRWCFEVGHSNC